MSKNPFPPEFESDPGAQESSATRLSCPEIDALLPAYAIGATDAGDTAVIRAHLQLCPIHAAELAKSSRLAQSMLFGAGEVQPPPRIANQLRRALDQPLTRLPPQPQAAQPHATWWQSWRWSAMWSAAAASLIILLGGLNFYWLRQNLELRQAYATLSAGSPARPTAATQQQAVYDLVTSEGIRFLDLPPAQVNDPVHAEVMWNPALNTALLYAEGFPNLPADQVYQLWLTYNGERQSGGFFQVDGQGNGVHIFAIPHPLDRMEIIGITAEPVGGSPKPTSDPVVRWKL